MRESLRMNATRAPSSKKSPTSESAPPEAPGVSLAGRRRTGRPPRIHDAGASEAASPERLVFAQNLRRSRRWLEMSQETMALRAGMSRSYVSGVELGERNISLDNMARLSSVLSVPLHQLLDPAYVPGAHLKPGSSIG